MNLNANGSKTRRSDTTMTDGPVKRSITIAGHRTSLSLEDEFWSALKSLAEARGLSIAELISIIDQARGSRNLSSAIRVFVLDYLTADRHGKIPSPASAKEYAVPSRTTDRLSD